MITSLELNRSDRNETGTRSVGKTINNKFVIHFKTQLKLGIVFALDQKCDATAWPDSFI